MAAWTGAGSAVAHSASSHEVTAEESQVDSDSRASGLRGGSCTPCSTGSRDGTAQETTRWRQGARAEALRLGRGAVGEDEEGRDRKRGALDAKAVDAAIMDEDDCYR